MKEYLTEALVLNIKSAREQDRLVDFYAKDLGRVRARVIGGRKIISKLSPHLNVLNLVKIRLIKKNQFTVADVIAYDCLVNLRKDMRLYSQSLELLFLLRSLVPEAVPDSQLWHYLTAALKLGKLNPSNLFKLLGYDPLLASCANCENERVERFALQEQSFLCSSCCAKTSLNRNNLIYIF